MIPKNKIILVAVMYFISDHVLQASYSAQYKIALQDFITVHKKYFPKKPIIFNNTSLVFSVYKRIITPWVLDINGRVHIVQNKFYAQQNYSNDLQTLWKNFKSYQEQINDLALYFPQNDRLHVLPAFYNEIGSDVVQILFNIIQEYTNQLTIREQDLESAFIIYKIAFEMYQPDMQISSLQQGADFQATLAGNMIILYQNAIKNVLYNLGIGMLTTAEIEKTYNQIARYYAYLAQIGTDLDDSQLISTNQLKAKQACQNYGYYIQAEKLLEQAIILLKKYPHSAVLDIDNVSQLTQNLNDIANNIRQVLKVVHKAKHHFEQAQDIFGANKSNFLYDLVDNVDLWIVQAIARLWILYLQDQTAQNQYTAPTIASFISQQNQNQENPVSNHQVIAALQNLSFLIEQKSNTINALATTAVLKNYSLNEILDSLQNEMFNFIQSGMLSDKSFSGIDNFVSLSTIIQSKNILFYISKLAQSIIETIQNPQLTTIAQSLGYAQQLDTIYKEMSDIVAMQISTIIPYFPNQITQTKNKNWYEWTSQILIASLKVTPQDLQKSKTISVQLQTPTLVQKKIKKEDVAHEKSLAYQNALNGNFSESAAQYQQIMNMDTTLYSINSDDTSLYDRMMQSKTMYAAVTFAASLESFGSQTWGNIKNIPVYYQALKYGFNNIDVSQLGLSQVPASLLSLSAGTVYTNISKVQQQDILKIIKAYIISELLSVQGVAFDQIFVDYNLQFQNHIDPFGQDLANQIRAQADIAFNKFNQTQVISVILADASNLQSIICKNVLLADVNPVLSTLPTALTFYSSAQLLMAQSKNQIKLGDSVYTPVNDQKLSQMFLQKMMYVYLSAAYPHWQQAKKLMDNLKLSLKQSSKIQNYPANFDDSLKLIDGYIIRAQALLYAQTQSAYAYALEGQNQNMAEEIEAIFFDVNQEYISWLKQCLTSKNPFDRTYQTLLHKINQMYVQWAALLAVQGKTEQIAKINNDIIYLFQTAGQGCMKISYEELLYPGFKQYHYATAAHYFLAVQMQYNKMKETQKAEGMNSLINDAYFKGSSQNIALFLHVQKTGVIINQDNQQENIAFSDLLAQKVSASLSVQHAYDSVQNLLLNAGIGYLFLTKRVQKLLPSDENKKAIVSQAQNPLSMNVTSYLQSNNVMTQEDVQPEYFNLKVLQTIFAINMQAYEQFKNNMVDYASWLTVIFSALKALYALNYLQAHVGITGKQMENELFKFVSELEQHTSSLENPASVYIG